MHRRFVALAALALSLLPAAVHADVIHMRSRADAVTVFPNAVSVHRAAQTQVRAGEHQLLFGPLPTSMSDDSVRIGGFGPDAVVEAVTVRVGRLVESTAPDIARLADEVAGLESQRTDLAMRYTAAVRTRDDLRQRHAPPDVIARADLSTADLARRASQAAQRLSERTAELQRMRAAGESSVKYAVVDVTTSRDGDLALTIEYLVPGVASWHPAYAAHLAADGAHVGLDVFASVQQATGEDWVGVRMSVSTVVPTTSLALPQLTERSIELEPEERADVEDEVVLRHRRVFATAAGIPAPRPAMPGSMNVQPRVEPPTPVLQRTGVVRANLLSARLEIPTVVTIRSGAAARRVLAAHTDLAATLEHVAAPRESASVFLAARLRNANRFPLLGGNVALFVDRDYVGTTALNPVPIAEDFLLPFGVDSGVTIDRTLAQRQLAHANGRDQTTLRYDFRLTNHRDRPVTVSVIDQLPVSRTQGLAVHTTPDTRAFSARREGDAPGVVRWQIATASGATERWNLGVTVASPARRTVSGEID